MNIGSAASVPFSAAGAPLSQTKGSETERSAQDAAAAERGADGDAKAERAAGIGQTQEDQETSERDADGRRLWEAPEEQARDAEEETDQAERRPKDPRGVSGNSLDLTG